MFTKSLKISKVYIDSHRGLPANCYEGFALSLIQSMFVGVYYYLSIYFVEVLHYNISTAGIIVAFYGIGAVFGGILGGRLSDKFSPSLISAISLISQSFTYIALAELQSFIFLTIAMFALGIASYSFITANYLFVLSYCQDSANQKLKAINILSMTSNLGLGLAAIAMSIFSSMGFHNIFYLASILLMLIAATSFIKLKKLSPEKIKTKNVSVISEDCNSKSKGSNWRLNLLVLSCVFFIGMIVSQFGVTYGIFIQKSYPELEVKAVTYVFALNAFLVVIMSAFLSDFIKLYNKILMVGIGGFLIGCGMFMLVLPTSLIFLISACIIYTIGEIIFFGVAQLICYENGLQNKKGKSLGLYRTIYATARVIGPALGGSIYAGLGSKLLWILSGVVGLMCLLICNYFKELN